MRQGRSRSDPSSTSSSAHYDKFEGYVGGQENGAIGDGSCAVSASYALIFVGKAAAMALIAAICITVYECRRSP